MAVRINMARRLLASAASAARREEESLNGQVAYLDDARVRAAEKATAVGEEAERLEAAQAVLGEAA